MAGVPPRREIKLIEQIASCAERFGQAAAAEVSKESMTSISGGSIRDMLNAGTPKIVRVTRVEESVSKKHPLSLPNGFPVEPPGR